MAEKELGTLSPEQVQKLANTISEAKDLTLQQAEMIEDILEGEEAISRRRISNLKEYFDIYSKNLDLVAKKYATTYRDATALGKAHADEVNKRANEIALNKIKQELEEKRRELEFAAREKHRGKLLKKDAIEIEKQLAAEFEARSKNQKRLAKEREEAFKREKLTYDDSRLAKAIQDYENQSNKHAKELNAARNQTPERQEYRLTEVRLKELDGALSAELEAQNLLNKINAEIAFTNTAEAGQYQAREVNAKTDAAALKALEKEISDYRAELDYESRLRNNNILTSEEAKQNERLVNAKFAQSKNKLLEEIKLEMLEREKIAHIKENDPAIFAALDTERAERKRKLELEVMRRNNGIISQEDRKQINDQLKDDFQMTSEDGVDLLKKLGERQLVNAELVDLKANDPALAAAADAKIKQEIADLEHQYRLEHNNELNEQARKEIEYQAKLKILHDKEGLKQLAEEQKQIDELSQFREANAAAAAAFDARRAKFIVEEEYKLRKQFGRLLTKEEHDEIIKRSKEELKLGEDNIKQLTAIQEREDKKKKRAGIAETDQTIAHATQLGGFSKEDNLLARIDSLVGVVERADDEDKGTAALAVAIKAISSLAAQLDGSIDRIASNQGFIDTRLQGSNNKTNYAGSYWGQLTKDMMSVGAVTPFFKQEDFAENIKSLVNRGIAFDLKQRAFLMTIQEKIANTFDVADGTLVRLIRIQQEDSTAGRLGMESALNTFLNNMYETSEYLSDVAQSVRSSLEEMESLMSGAEATEVEFQVQKWMGSLYSVGMSNEAVNSIASALGQIAAGQVEALTNNSGAGNLMVMAANEAGLAISDILIKGLNAQETNQLLQATVNYLAELAESSKDNQVVQQQLANVFGVKASDLRAATNLSTNNTVKDVFSTYKTYDNMLKQLNDMADSMMSRTSIGEMMTNVWDNGMYTLASSMANNPIAYLTYKMSSLLEGATGGISIPAISAAGFGVDLETTVADLLRVASLSTGVIGSLGDMIAGLGASFSGQAMLAKMGIEKGSGLQVTPRGTSDSSTALPSPGSGGNKTTSSSGYVGNASSSDIKSTTIQESEDTKEQLMVEAMEEERAHQIDFINENVLKIYELLDEVTSGKRNFSVKVAGYGLTSNTALSGAQGGVSGLLNNNSSGSGGNVLTGGLNNGSSNTSNSGVIGNTSSSSNGSTGGYSVNTGLDLGGWTMT